MISKISNLSKSALFLSYYNLKDSLNHTVDAKDETLKKHLGEIQTKGFTIIENFYNPKECTTAKNEIDRLWEKYKDSAWSDGADHRLHGAERVSDIVADYYNHPFVRELTDAFHGNESVYLFTLAARINATEENLGSGGGWHRDSVHFRQLKSILYLSDVGPEHGPFQYLEGTQHQRSIYASIEKAGIQFGQMRFSEEEIERIQKIDDYPLHTLTAKAGTLVIADTFGIHRGMPIQEGVRYAFTNYFYAKHQFSEKQAKKWEPYYIV